MPSPELLLKIFFSLLAFFIIGALFSVLIFVSVKLLRVRADRKHTLRIENRGNCRSMYTLSVSSSEPVLRFSLFAQGVPLVEVQDVVADEEEFPEFVPDVAPSASSLAPAPAKGPATTTKAASVNMDSATKAGQSTAAKAGTVASLLGSLGQLLPGPLGAGLRAQSAQARGLQTGTSRAVQAPQVVQGRVGSVQKESGKLVGAKPAASKQTASNPARAAHSQPVTNTSAARTGSGASAAARAQATAADRSYRVQTPELAPGQSIDLTLQIGTHAKRYPVGSYAYAVQSQQIALDFPDISSEPIERNGVTYFKPVAGWRYWLPGFASILLVLLSVIFLTYFYLLIWQ